MTFNEEIEIEEVEKLLENKWRICDSILHNSWTKTHCFIFPLLSESIKFHFSLKRHYICSYIADEKRNVNIENPILIHFKTTDIEGDIPSMSWDKLFNTLIKEEGFCYYYYVGNDKIKNEVIFAFTIPEEFKEDYNLIVKGKYSKTSKEYKDKVIQFFLLEKETCKLVRGVLYKEKWVKESLEKLVGQKLPTNAEYWSDFVNHREFFRTTRNEF